MILKVTVRLLSLSTIETTDVTVRQRSRSRGSRAFIRSVRVCVCVCVCQHSKTKTSNYGKVGRLRWLLVSFNGQG